MYNASLSDARLLPLTSTYLNPSLPRTTGSLLINFDRVDKPISIRKCLGIQLHVRVTRISPGATAARLPDVWITCPLPAECGVEYDVHVLEVCFHIAVAGEFSHRRAPLACIGSVASDVGGNAGAREEPNLDGLIRPFGSVDTAADSVKAGAEGVAVLSDDTASCILLLTAGVGVAVGGVERALRRGIVARYRATSAGMQCHLVRERIVYTLDYVDLATSGPGASA